MPELDQLNNQSRKYIPKATELTNKVAIQMTQNHPYSINALLAEMYNVLKNNVYLIPVAIIASVLLTPLIIIMYIAYSLYISLLSVPINADSIPELLSSLIKLEPKDQALVLGNIAHLIHRGARNNQDIDLVIFRLLELSFELNTLPENSPSMDAAKILQKELVQSLIIFLASDNGANALETLKNSWHKSISKARETDLPNQYTWHERIENLAIAVMSLGTSVVYNLYQSNMKTGFFQSRSALRLNKLEQSIDAVALSFHAFNHTDFVNVRAMYVSEMEYGGEFYHNVLSRPVTEQIQVLDYLIAKHASKHDQFICDAKTEEIITMLDSQGIFIDINLAINKIAPTAKDITSKQLLDVKTGVLGGLKKLAATVKQNGLHDFDESVVLNITH